jgi:outer membrane lipoprotein carrier protein
MRKNNLRQKLFYIFLYGICFIFSSALYAQSAADILSTKLNNLKTLKADFSQSVQDKNGNELQHSRGNMALMRPGLFRWETQLPNQQLIIADGKTIWIVDKDLQQVTKQKQNSENNTPGLLLSDSVDHLASRFTITHEDKKNTIFKLVPKGKKDLFQSVELFFNHETLSKMILHDGLGQTTVITFDNSESNTNLSRDLFSYTPPQHYDVME